MTYTAPDAAVLDAMLSTVKYDASGLIAAIAQQHDTGEVLMIAG